MVCRLVSFLALLALCGCTHRQLERSMVNQASTVMDIEYQMVLDNIAMFECNPGALPWHVRIDDGVVQVNDSGGVVGLGVQWGSSPNFTRGPQVTRSVTEQWGADAVTNPRIVKRLQDLYRQVIGLPPEPDPTFFQFVNQLRAELRADAGQDKPENATPQQEELPPGPIASDDQAHHGTGSNAVRANMLPGQAIWQEVEIPVGWFHVGKKCDVPSNACYVGKHCDTYVWVMHDGLNGLSRFSLIVLAITDVQTKNLVSQELTYTR
jgi:hypothetical protein